MPGFSVFREASTRRRLRRIGLEHGRPSNSGTELNAGACYWSGGTLAFWSVRRQNGAMPSVQVKDVPSDVHATLRRRASAAGQSLQEYLLERLTEEARTPTLDEVLDRAGGRAGGSVSFKAAVAAVRTDRDRR